MTSRTVIHHINKIISNTDEVILDFSGGLVIPKGQETSRIDTLGSMRFNIDTNKFEAYDGDGWLPIGPFVSDSDGDTGIFAEKFTGSNDNTLTFKNAGITNALIDSDGNFYIHPTIVNDIVEDSTFYIEKNSGNVGIKTQDPTSDFTVAGVVEANEFVGIINGGTY